jgi:C1A family cysteine protease
MTAESTVSVWPARYVPRGLGWHRDLQDFRDFTPDSPPVKSLFDRLPPSAHRPEALPAQVDLRGYFPEVYDQQSLNACSALACAGLVEYFDHRAFGNSREPSGLFLHQMTRKLLRTHDDCGAGLRLAFKAMLRFGMPPARLWPYEAEKLSFDPEAFLYSFAESYRSLLYVRLDPRNACGSTVLKILRAFLAAGFPIAFGFPVPSSVTHEQDIPYRPMLDSVRGGQAVVACGYDDKHIGSTRGALLIRNAWGKTWGEQGYGWLPYRYVEEQLASDYWTLISPDWLAMGDFARPALES